MALTQAALWLPEFYFLNKFYNIVDFKTTSPLVPLVVLFDILYIYLQININTNHAVPSAEPFQTGAAGL
jgi:hypothetical protein